MRGNNNDNNNNARPRPALEFSMDALKRAYDVPYAGSVPGYALVAAVVAALVFHSPMAALLCAGLIYYAVFVHEAAPAVAAAPQRAATYNNFSGSSVQQTQARNDKPVDAEQVRRARQEKFGSIGQIRQDKM